MTTLTRKQFEEKYGAVSDFQKSQTGERPNYMKRLTENVGTDIYDRTNRVGDILKNPDTNIATKGLQTFGQGAGLAANTLEQTVAQIPGVDKAVEGIGSGINWLATSKWSPAKYAGDVIGSSEKLQEATRLYDTDQSFKDTVDAVANIGRLGMDVQGVVDSAGFVRNVTNKLGNKITPALQRGVDSVSSVTKSLRGTKLGNNAVTRAGERLKTNLQANKATNQAIDSLPSKVARDSVRQGVELPDAQFLNKIPKAQKVPLAKLYEATKKFVAGKSKTNPIEIVGKPVAKRLQQLQAQTTKLGARLDTVASSLKGKVVNGYDNVVSSVNESLSKLDIGIKGNKLSFKGSAFENLGKNGELIKTVYQKLMKSKDAADFHKIKKLIDNAVDFGKKGEGLTGDAQRLLKGWRKQIDTTLDNQFKSYNTVNTELAKRIRPIKDLTKALKADGLDVDLVNMKAGMLMRRITSNAQSNPAIRQILRDLDSATKVKGKVALNVEKLVDFYAILEKYYPEIVGKNTFKGQITGAVENVQGVQEMIVGSLKKISGKTDAVQRHAIEALMDDLFKKLQ